MLTSQRYEQYTDNEHRIWRTIFGFNKKFFRLYASRLYEPYLTCLEALELDSERIPTIESINAKLNSTGWKTVCVDGYIPAKTYANFIADRIFPLSRNIRAENFVYFSPMPDLVHDVFGHLPLLFDEAYRDYLQRLAALMCSATTSPLDDALYQANRRLGILCSLGNAPPMLVEEAEAEVERIQRQLRVEPSELTELARLFLWSIEFGLIGTQDSYRILGAGLLSSISECASLYAPGVNIRPYSIEAIKQDIHFVKYQSQYYLIESQEHMMRVLTEYTARKSGNPDPASVSRLGQSE